MSRDNWNDEKFLTDIKELAKLQFVPDEIALMVSIDSLDKNLFVKSCLHETHPFEKIFTAYQSGKLEEEILVRKAIMTAAKQGSPPAQSAATKLILNNRLKERGR